MAVDRSYLEEGWAKHYKEEFANFMESTGSSHKTKAQKNME